MIKLLIRNVCLAIFFLTLGHQCAFAQNAGDLSPLLGPPPTAPLSPSSLPRNGPRKQDVTGGFSVNNNLREQVREFYDAVYFASDNIPILSSANTAECVAGTNSAAFQEATLWRINWFRAMSGIPASVTFLPSESAEDQIAALMMSANNQLLHTGIPPSWSCFDSSGTNAAADSNLALGYNGPAAITGYIWDYGANQQVGHRRWILYPQTQIMGCGDVPPQGAHDAANATWILDANFGGPRPATTSPFVAWPPPGYVPYPVVFPLWSFALSNADLSSVVVSMQSNGQPMNVTLQPNQSGFGEETAVWYPSSLNPSNVNTVFPFSGTDTVFSITVSNVRTSSGTASFSYAVTVFDPALTGPDYVPTIVDGTNRPSVNANNPYSCNPSANPHINGYQWVQAQASNGNLADNALNGLTNFTISPPPIYSVITNPPGTTGKCFHLSHTNPAPQLFQFKEILFPATNTSLSFQSLLGYATTNEIARVQVSTNGGGEWVNIFTEVGTGGAGQKKFVSNTLSLSNFAGLPALVRFNYDYSGGSYYAATSPKVGWYIEHILMTNASSLIQFSTNFTGSTNFDFVPPAPGNWILKTRGLIYDQFGLDWSPIRFLTAVTDAAPTLLSIGIPTITSAQAQIPFTISQGAASTFTLQEASQITGPWSAAADASLSIVVPGSSFVFTTGPVAGTTFYRVLAQP